MESPRVVQRLGHAVKNGGKGSATPCERQHARTALSVHGLGHLLELGVATDDASDTFITQLIQKVQKRIYQRRIRAREAFADFDRLRCGCCTKQQFLRALNFLEAPLQPEEGEALAEHFTEVGRQPQAVSYTKFCQVVDEVFGVGNLETKPKAKVPLPGESIHGMVHFTPAEVEGGDRVLDVLYRIAVITGTRGVDLRRCFQDRQQSRTAALAFPRFSGKTTQQVFLSRFPFTSELGEQDTKLLLDRYRTEGRGVHVSAFLDDVEKMMQHKRTLQQEEHQAPQEQLQQEQQRQQLRDLLQRHLQPQQQQQPQQLQRSCSSGTIRIPARNASQATLRRVPSASSLMGNAEWGAVEERPTLLRPGSALAVRSEKPKPVATALHKASLLRPLSAIASRRSRAQSMPRVDVMTRLNTAFRERRLEPQEQFKDFDPMRKGICTASALRSVLTVLGVVLDGEDFGKLFEMYGDEAHQFRYMSFCADLGDEVIVPLRHKADLEPNAQRRLEELLAQLSSRVHLRRMEIRSTFNDFNQNAPTARPGHVTLSQFPRAMTMLGFTLSKEHVQLLCQAYCDSADGDSFNYLEFCTDIDKGSTPTDPPSVRMPRPATYFDEDGRVVPLGIRRPVSAPCGRVNAY